MLAKPFAAVSRLALGLLALALAPSLASAQTELVLPAGAPRVLAAGTVTGASAEAFTLTLDAATAVTVALEAPSPSVNFDLAPPPPMEPMHVGALDGPVFEGTLPVAGTYSISVYLEGQAAEEGRSVPFTVTVTRVGEPIAEFADALAGGPDFWEVANLTTRLNLRAEPSTDARILATARLGTALRNHGCRIADDRRWCEIETRDGLRAWAAGDYLHESTGPGF